MFDKRGGGGGGYESEISKDSEKKADLTLTDLVLNMAINT